MNKGKHKTKGRGASDNEDTMGVGHHSKHPSEVQHKINKRKTVKHRQIRSQQRHQQMLQESRELEQARIRNAKIKEARQEREREQRMRMTDAERDAYWANVYAEFR